MRDSLLNLAVLQTGMNTISTRDSGRFGFSDKLRKMHQVRNLEAAIVRLKIPLVHY